MQRSKALIAHWSEVIVRDRTRQGQLESDESWNLDVEFERINGGCQGSLEMLATCLKGNDQSLRRASANVIGSIRIGIGNRAGDWEAFRSQELKLAANYVLDEDPVTASDAVASFVDLLDGEKWDQWSQVQPIWNRALATVGAPRSRGLAELFAFTSVPIAGSARGILRLYDSNDPETRSLSFWAVDRAEILEPAETESAFFNETRSKLGASRARAFADLQTLGPIFWSPREGSYVVPDKEGLTWHLQTAWWRCTVTQGPYKLLDQLRETEESHDRILDVLNKGLDDDVAAIRLSSAKALVAIGKFVDWDLGVGAMTTARSDQPKVARLLEKASRTVQQQDPALASQAESLVAGFNRPRVVG